MSFRLAVIRMLTKRRAEKFFRKLAGMADLEDALKRLDRLTQEEARMANAEVLRVAHSIRDGVKVVDGKIEEVGDKVGDVGDKVECVDEKVRVIIDGARTLSGQLEVFLTYIFSDSKQAAKEIGVKIEDVGDKVQCVDEKVQVVINGLRSSSSRFSHPSNVHTPDGKQARVAAKDIDDKVQVVIDGTRGLSSQ